MSLGSSLQSSQGTLCRCVLMDFTAYVQAGLSSRESHKQLPKVLTTASTTKGTVIIKPCSQAMWEERKRPSINCLHLCGHSLKNLGICVCLQKVGKIGTHVIERQMRQQVKKHFLVHVGYLETCHCSASLLLRSQCFCLSLSTSPTQEQQLCIGKPSTFTRSAHAVCRPWQTMPA